MATKNFKRERENVEIGREKLTTVVTLEGFLLLFMKPVITN